MQSYRAHQIPLDDAVSVVLLEIQGCWKSEMFAQMLSVKNMLPMLVPKLNHVDMLVEVLLTKQNVCLAYKLNVIPRNRKALMQKHRG